MKIFDRTKKYKYKNEFLGISNVLVICLFGLIIDFVKCDCILRFTSRAEISGLGFVSSSGTCN